MLSKRSGLYVNNNVLDSGEGELAPVTFLYISNLSLFLMFVVSSARTHVNYEVKDDVAVVRISDPTSKVLSFHYCDVYLVRLVGYLDG